VRSRLLDFILILREQLPDEPSKAQKESLDAVSLFNNSVLGDHATIIFGDKNKVSAINTILQGNAEALKHELLKYNVPEPEIDNLLVAIEQDAVAQIENPLEQKDSKVNGWMQEMLHKAVDASWNIELSIAGGILGDAIKHYYGL